MISSWHGAWAYVFSLSLAACGAAETGDTGSPIAPIALEDFCDRFAEARCLGRATCCANGGTTDPTNLLCLIDEREDCGVDVRDVRGGFPTFGESTDLLPGIGYDAHVGAMLIAELESAVAACRPNRVVIADAFFPVLSAGQACRSDRECVADTVCRPTATGASDRACTALGNEGDACTNQRQCAMPLHCTGPEGSRFCTRGVDVGEDCSNVVCRDALWCRTYPGPPRCEPRLASGASCIDTAVADLPCAPEDQCEERLGTGMYLCTPRHLNGESCSSTDECASRWCAHDGAAHFCAPCENSADCNDGLRTGACVNQQCDPTLAPDPLDLAGPDGALCHRDADCRSAICHDSICIEPTAGLLYCRY